MIPGPSLINRTARTVWREEDFHARFQNARELEHCACAKTRTRSAHDFESQAFGQIRYEIAVATCADQSRARPMRSKFFERDTNE